MVCVFVKRVQVRHLDNGQKRKKSQAQQRADPKSLWLTAATGARIWLVSWQINLP
jgi:hypothetical protein